MYEKERKKLLEGYKAPPRLLEVEEVILQSMVEDRDALVEGLSRIDPERDLYSEDNRRIFGMIQRMYEKYRDVSSSVLMDKLLEIGLNHINFNGPGEAFRIDLLIRELIEYRTKREIFMASKEAMDNALSEAVYSEDIQASLLSSMNTWAVTGELRAQTISEIKEAAEKSQIGSRLPILDPILGRFLYKDVGSHLGTVEVIAAHPKHGKSTYSALRAADYARQGYKGLVITLENLTSEVATTIEATLGDDAEKYRDNVLINDDAFELDEITRLIWQYRLKHDIKWVVVDYLQLIEVKGIKNYDEVKQIKIASKTLTRAAKENGIFLMNVAQPHNISSDRKGWDRALTADDLYGSGQIKKDAFCVTTVFRPGLDDELLFENTQSKRRMALNPEGRLVNSNSVFVRIDVQRKGVPSRQWLQLVHTDNGLTVQQEPGIEPSQSSNWKPIKSKA
jgi:replicative DNA helicase